MGHESQIELWSPPDYRSALLVSELTGFVVKKAMKTAGRETQTTGLLARQPSTWRGRSEQISLVHVGCEARDIRAEGDVFSLDFDFYRTKQAFGRDRTKLHARLSVPCDNELCRDIRT